METTHNYILCDSNDHFWISDTEYDSLIPPLLQSYPQIRFVVVTDDENQLNKSALPFSDFVQTSSLFQIKQKKTDLSQPLAIISSTPFEFLAKSEVNPKFTILKAGYKVKISLEVEENFYSIKNTEDRKDLFHISSLAQIREIIEKKEAQRHISVAYHFTHKKFSELYNQGTLGSSLKTDVSISFFPIDLRHVNRYQLKTTDVIFHKNSDFKKGYSQDELAQIDKNLFLISQEYKNIKIIDRMDNISIIQKRRLFQDAFNELIPNAVLPHFKLCTPQMIYLPNLDQIPQDIKYPVIIKTDSACSTKYSHTMAVVVSEDGLKNAVQQACFKNEPLVIQQLVQHSGILFKLYSIGDSVDLQIKKSIPNISMSNFTPSHQFQIIDSQKDLCEQLLPILKDQQQPNLSIGFELQQKILEHSKALSQEIQKRFNLTVFGYDLLLEDNSNQIFIVDVNYFPGSKGVANLAEKYQTLFFNY